MTSTESFATLGEVLGTKQFCPDCHTLMKPVSSVVTIDEKFINEQQWECPKCDYYPEPSGVGITQI